MDSSAVLFLVRKGSFGGSATGGLAPIPAMGAFSLSLPEFAPLAASRSFTIGFLPCGGADLGGFVPVRQERKRHINLRKSLGHRPGVSGTPGGTNRGLPAGVPGAFLLFTVEKQTEKGIFAGTPAGCPRDIWPSRGVSEILCDFFLCAFSAP